MLWLCYGKPQIGLMITWGCHSQGKHIIAIGQRRFKSTHWLQWGSASMDSGSWQERWQLYCSLQALSIMPYWFPHYCNFPKETCWQVAVQDPRYILNLSRCAEKNTMGRFLMSYVCFDACSTCTSGALHMPESWAENMVTKTEMPCLIRTNWQRPGSIWKCQLWQCSKSGYWKVS